MMKEKILTKIVGTQHYNGVVEVGESVQVVKDEGREYPQVLAVFNEGGEKLGNIVSNVDDFDLVVNEVVNNFELYDVVEDYSFTVKRVAKYYVTLIGTLKEDNDDVSIEVLEVQVANYKESIHNMITSLYEAQDDGDVLLANHLKVLIDDAITIHNDKSNRLMQLKNELIVTKGTSKVFDYYSSESAK